MKFIPGPADVTRIGSGADRVYVVDGVMRLGSNGTYEPAVTPSRPMRIRPLRDVMFKHGRERWYLEIAGEQHSRHYTLLEARYAASAAEYEVKS